MNIEEMDNMLREFTEDELFYREYFESKKDSVKFQSFINSLDRENIKSRYLIIPEIFLSSDYISEEDLFSLSYHTDILIMKHNRFTPIFKHRHEFFEMIYVYSGHCNQEINGERIHLQEGEICIIPPKVEHTIEVFHDSIILNVLIKRSTFNDTFLEILKYETVLSSFFIKVLFTEDYSNYIIFRTNQEPNLREILSKLFIEYHESKKYAANILYNLLMLFFSFLLREYEGQVVLPKRLPHKEKVLPILTHILTHIQNNYKTVTLGELSAKFHFTESYVSKLIKATYGQTFTDIIQTIKLNKAIELLISSDLKIQHISESIGFENNTHFIRTFKKAHGISPNQYRKNVKNKVEIECKES